MRAGLGTILQTLMPEAAAVLKQSVAEAARRGHSQTTPLHVAAALLASPAGLLRTACNRSHPTSSHPLQCRALELCFSVALDRLPSSSSTATASNSDASASNGAGATQQPQISNALMAALKRAQANQRRGCPEQQQQPLLAVKVEVEQLVVSILDDPGVSRVMREARFSSPAVKATIEQSFATSVASAPTSVSPSPAASTNSLTVGVTGGVPGGFRNLAAPGTRLLPADRSLNLNALLQQQQGNGHAAPATTSAISSANPSPSVSINSLPLVGGGGVLGGFRGRATPGTPLLPGNRSLYLNPRLQQQQGIATAAGSNGGGVGQQRDQAKRVLAVLLRTRRRNPILIGDSHVEVLMKEVLQGIEVAGDGPLRKAEVISLVKQLPKDKSQIPQKLQELANSIDARFKSAAAGVILDVGDLKWLVETPGGATLAVAEMAKLLASFAEGNGGRIWVVGTANSATYLRCQVNHPTMVDDWDLQAVHISPPAPATLVGVLPWAASNEVLGSSPDSLTVQRRFSPVGAAPVPARLPPSETVDGSRREMCPVCKDSYEHELAKLVAKEFEKSSSDSKAGPWQSLPPWLQLAKRSNGIIKPTTTQLPTQEQELTWKQTTEELLKRWTETCSRVHPILTQLAAEPRRPPPPNLEMPNLNNSNLLLWRSTQARMQPASGGCGPLPSSNHGGPATTTSARLSSPPGSPVRTELVLGRGKPPPPSVPSTEKPPGKLVGDPVGFASGRFPGDHREKVAAVSNLDLNSFKRLFKGLTEKVSWQPEAASSVAAIVIQCKSGTGRRRRGAASAGGDAWLLFFGPDKVGKNSMAVALSETLVGRGPVTVRFGGGDAESDVSSRGKTALDRVVEAVRHDPFSMVVLENVDFADALVLGNLRRAMERGRLADSHGREVSLGSAIFVLISDSLPEDLSEPQRGMKRCEEKLFAAANSGWQLELALGENPGKRRAVSLCKDVRPAKTRKQSAGLSLDLNLAAGSDEDVTESSRNSSDLTVELDHNDCRRLPMLSHRSGSSAALTELVKAVDEAVMFKPVDFGELRRKVADAITLKFRAVVGDGGSLYIEDEALDRVVGGVWFGTTPTAGFDEWTESVLVPGFRQLRGHTAGDGGTVARLLAAKNVCTPRGVKGLVREWLPSRVGVAVDGLCGA